MTSVEEIVGICIFWAFWVTLIDYFLEKKRKWSENE